MIITLSDISKQNLVYDVCIIGSGPAALSLVHQLQKNTSLRIAVMEGSSIANDYLEDTDPDRSRINRIYSNFNPHNQDQYKGHVSGWIGRHRPDYLTEGRFRAYGGTGNVWSGWICTLDRHDVEAKWPIEYEELEEYYSKSYDLFDLPPIGHDNVDSWLSEIGENKEDQVDGDLRTRIIYFNRINFGLKYIDFFSQSKNVDLILNANFLKFSFKQHHNQKIVSAAEFVSVESSKISNPLSIEAKYYTVATGAIENTRILLLSDIQKDSASLGKLFCEHFYMWNAGTFDVGDSLKKEKKIYFSPYPIQTSKGTRIMGILVPRKEFIEKNKINNFRVLLGGSDEIPGTINVSWEQECTENNYLDILDDMPPDSLGHKRIHLHTDFSALDRDTLVSAISTAKDHIEKNFKATNFCIPDLNSDPSSWDRNYRIAPGNHPMGTTRMSFDPKEGVVDPNCRLHTVENLYVAGSSVFPCGGYANPTLTIIALSVRIANHITKMEKAWI